MNKLDEFVNRKNICVSLDFTEKQKIVDIIHLFGKNVKMYKIHCDIIDEFDDVLYKNLIY